MDQEAQPDIDRDNADTATINSADFVFTKEDFEDMKEVHKFFRARLAITTEENRVLKAENQKIITKQQMHDDKWKSQDIANYKMVLESKNIKEQLTHNTRKFNEDIQDCQFETNNLKNTCSLVKVHELNKVDKIDFMKLKSKVESEYTSLVKFREYTNTANAIIERNKDAFDAFVQKCR